MVTWVIKAYTGEDIGERIDKAPIYIEAVSHVDMIDQLKLKGFKRLWKDDVPYNVPPLTDIVAEDLWYTEGDIHLLAEVWDIPRNVRDIPRVEKLMEPYRVDKRNAKTYC